jgi:hypothetical protein
MAYSPTISTPANGAYLNPAVLSGIGQAQFYNTPYDFYNLQYWITRRERNTPAGLSFIEMLMAQGATLGRNAPTSSHYEVGKHNDNLVVGVVGANPGAGGDLLVTLAASSMFAQAGVNQAYPYENLVGENLAGVKFQITNVDRTVNPFVVTLTPRNAADNVFTGMAAGQRLFLQFPASVEGAGFQTPTTRRTARYDNTFQKIAGNAKQATDVDMLNMVRFDGVDVNGSVTSGSMYVFDEGDMLTEHNQALGNAAIFGTTANNITMSTGIGNGVTTVADGGAQGLLDFMEDYAFIQTYVPGFLTWQHLQKIPNTFIKEGIRFNDFWGYDGIDIHQEIGNVARDYIREIRTKEVPIAVTAENETISINSGITAINIDGYNIAFKLLDNLSDNRMGGTAGYKYPNYLMVIPKGMFKNLSTGDLNPSILLEYKELKGKKHLHKLRILDGTGFGENAPYVSQNNAIRIAQYESEISMHVSCGNNMMLFRPA